MACFLVPMSAAIVGSAVRKKISEKLHFDWLISMLWGGVLMLAVEHIAHREVMPYPPFLTHGLKEVLPEMLKVGVPMTLTIVLVWAIMVLVVRLWEKRKSHRMVENLA